jgi:hypothetical protein
MVGKGRGHQVVTRIFGEKAGQNMNRDSFERIQNYYLIGWKRIARYIGVHPRTVKRWHYERVKIPLQKTYPSKQGRVIAMKSEEM